MDKADACCGFRKIERRMRFLSKKKVFICYIITIWIAGILLSYLFMGNKSNNLEVPNSFSVLYPHHTDKINLSDFRIDSFHDYCNPIDGRVTGNEGLSKEDHRLEFVSVFIRHGDRGPLQREDKHNGTNTYCGIPKSYDHIYDHYVQSVSKLELPKTFKHFQRLPNGDECEKSMLTKVGVLQLINLGSFLHKRYFSKLAVFQKHGSDISKKIKVFVSPALRTFQSGLAFLHSFAPGLFNASLLDVMMTNITFCFDKKFCECKMANQMGLFLHQQSDNLVHNHPAISDLLSTINRVMNGDVSPLRPSVGIDHLSLFVCHGQPYPCSMEENKCLGAEHLQRLMSYVEWAKGKLVDNPDYQKVCRLKTQGFFIHLLENMLGRVVPRKTDGTAPPEFVLYSGHDTNIEAVLTAMGPRISAWPPYSSRIAFELYSHEVEVNQITYRIRVLFNGKDVTRYTSFCKDLWKQSKHIEDIDEIAWCPFDNFIDFVNNYHLKITKAKTFADACKVLHPN